MDNGAIGRRNLPSTLPIPGVCRVGDFNASIKSCLDIDPDPPLAAQLVAAHGQDTNVTIEIQPNYLVQSLQQRHLKY